MLDLNVAGLNGDANLPSVGVGRSRYQRERRMAVEQLSSEVSENAGSQRDVLQRQVIAVLGQALQLGDQVAAFDADTALIGELPEFDSMAVVAVLGSLEDEFEIVVDDDDVSAETFLTVATLVEFVEAKLVE